ncbi:hypothetical protein CABS02_01150 [Colletotrichum abscissum]|uniref:Uncharacterized protein n=1 Tax=Colletotrichum abscissum TaxID=1671311 RepID=A0A9P9XQM0_9PEZI|nr:hypothetical protein CABS02_01150 [Colletotrichum abscissum]
MHTCLLSKTLRAKYCIELAIKELQNVKADAVAGQKIPKPSTSPHEEWSEQASVSGVAAPPGYMLSAS